ncbi:MULTISPECIES: HepT-like ribonuclease domain-containing protein [unclassified Rhizobium]|uniref:HepT-like ribonuclease domain-containing protein n=2 Tax=unclassified Rhizobium TaxID=2613769 RepID=UPI0027DC38CE|nr:MULTISPECIES: HepT-like ribonuclease domain-containing protein [unclassified Rhizobium]
MERCIQIISEAAKELPSEMRASEPDIPWRAIIGIGNLLRHEYYRIRPGDLWDIIHVHLPKLRPAIARLLSEAEQ